jgi:hypothetical protein
MPSESTVRMLSPQQRDLLIAHIDVPVEIRTDNSQQVRSALIKAGFLRTHPYGAARPRHTELTTEGRYAVAMVLESYAAALVRAGLLEQENPIGALKALAEWKGTVRNPAPIPTPAASLDPIFARK